MKLPLAPDGPTYPIYSLASPTQLAPPGAIGRLPDTVDADPSQDLALGDWEEVTARRLDLPRALGGLLALVSRVETLASAVEREFAVMDCGATSGYPRRRRRVGDLLGAAREAALRALEIGDEIQAEVARREEA